MEEINIKKLTKMIKQKSKIIVYINEKSCTQLCELDQYIADFVNNIDNKRFVLYINPINHKIEWDDNIPTEILENVYYLIWIKW